MPTAKKSPAKKKPTAMSWDEKIERLQNRKPAERFVTVPDEETVLAAEAARLAWLEARREARLELMRAEESYSPTEDDIDAHPKVVEARTTYEEAVETAEDASLVFHFRQLPPEVYDTFQMQHPPTEAQEAQGMSYNPDTYFPALMAACSVEPLTEEQAASLVRAFNTGEAALVHGQLLEVNERPRMTLGKGLRPTSG